MVHQRGDCLFLLLRRAVAVKLNHVGPIVSGGTEIGVLLTITRSIVAMLARSRNRPFPILHDLGHGCSHTTRGTSLRNIHVERRALVPTQLNQRLNDGKTSFGMQTAVFFEVHPAGNDVACCRTALFHHRGDASRKLVHHETQTIGSGFISEIALIGIAENGRRGVVGSHDNVTAIEIEDVHCRHAVVSIMGVSQLHVLHVVFGEHGLVLDKIKSQALRLRHINGTCL